MHRPTLKLSKLIFVIKFLPTINNLTVHILMDLSLHKFIVPHIKNIHIFIITLQKQLLLINLIPCIIWLYFLFFGFLGDVFWYLVSLFEMFSFLWR